VSDIVCSVCQGMFGVCLFMIFGGGKWFRFILNKLLGLIKQRLINGESTFKGNMIKCLLKA